MVTGIWCVIWYLASGTFTRYMVCGIWYMVYGTWYMVHGMVHDAWDGVGWDEMGWDWMGYTACSGWDGIRWGAWDAWDAWDVLDGMGRIAKYVYTTQCSSLSSCVHQGRAKSNLSKLCHAHIPFYNPTCIQGTH